MSATINVPKIRVGSSIPMAITLTDNGVAVDWSSVGEIAVLLYFEGKKLFGGKCTYEVSGTTLNVVYSADKPQFLGIADVVINCKYLGMEKTFDRPVVEFVATTAEATGQSQITRDPLAVDIDVEDVDTSLLDAAIHAAVAAAAEAMEAASHGPMIGEDGYWYVWDAAQGEYVNTGVYAEGSGGGGDTRDCVKVTEQSFDAGQKAQARSNIGAGTSNFSGNYNDLTNRPSIPAAQVNADWNANSGVAQILNKPTIPDVSGKADKVSSPTTGDFAGLDANGNLKDSGKKASDFATAAQGAKADTAVQPEAGKGLFSGNYNDLTNKPTIPAAQVNSDWNASSGVAQILNKPTIPDAQIQSDWNQSDNTAKDYIKNKPSIPAAQVNSDWNANSGVAQILNKPAIPDAVEANPTVPSGTTPTALTGLKVGSSYYSTPDVSGKENTSNKVTSLSSSSTNTQYPAAKTVYDEVHPAIGSSQPAGGFLPGEVYDLGTLTGTVTFALATPSDANVANPYCWTFETGSTAPSVNWPSGIIWPDDFTPDVDENKHYEVLVRKGYASMLVYTLPTE